MHAPLPRTIRVRRRIAGQRLPHLFSDLNQWMLKVLLAESIPANLLSAPRARYRNPTELARAAGGVRDERLPSGAPTGK